MAFLPQTPLQRLSSYNTQHNNKYFYNETDLSISGRSTITVLCSIHGPFNLFAKEHLRGKGCPICKQHSIDRNLAEQRINWDTAREASKLKELQAFQQQNKNASLHITLHKNFSSTLTCSIHGVVRDYLRREPISPHASCYKCDLLLKASLQEEVINNANQSIVNPLLPNLPTTTPKGYTYTYLPTNLDFFTNQITSVCSKHGKHPTNYKNRLQGKSNCPICAGTKRLTKKDILLRFQNSHPNSFDYSRMKYTTTDKKILIRCIKHNKWFKVTPSNHETTKTGGCPECSILSGFQHTLPGILYYIKINNTAYKIGVTNFSVIQHFQKDKTLTSYKLIKQWTFPAGKDAYLKKQEILKAFKEHQYTSTNLLDSGNTELFTHDILKLDKDTNDHSITSSTRPSSTSKKSNKTD